MKFLSSLAVLGVVAVLAATPGCATVPDPDPPDLSPSEQAIELRHNSVVAAQESIGDDLERLEELSSSIASIGNLLSDADLPHSLLRLVVINCLNTEYQGLTSPVAGLEGTPLTCRPTHATQLLERLDQVPTATRDDALQLLFLVDQARILRGSLRMRLSTLPDTISDHRDFIADERARLRQLEADLQRRRGRYSTRGWREIMTYLDDHRQQLMDFDQKLDEFEELYPAWPSRIDEMMSQIYFDLIELRPPSPREAQSFEGL